ncbi:hypothetical protein ACQJBY_043936 [Aegilops geniculata]
MAHGAAASGGAASAAARASRGAPGTWRRVRRAAREAAAHALLLCFTTLLAFKLDGVLFPRSWWVLFIPLWLFHAAVARYRFSLPAPSLLQNYQRIPCHSIVATTLLVAFELLLCIYLEGQGEPFLDLKLVFLPLLALEIITLVDNFRMFGALMPGHGETITDEEIWDRLPHFWVAISMVFLLAATSLMLLKLCGDAVTLGWWDLFINFGISQCFAFLVCIRWSNPMVGIQPILGYWWPCTDNSYRNFSSSPMYALRGYSILCTVYSGSSYFLTYIFAPSGCCTVCRLEIL